LWITLTEEQSWLYSTPKQEITIKYENEVENKIILNKIGKSSVSRKCKISTLHVTLCTQKAIKAKVIQAYLPKFNLTLDYKSNKEIKSRIKIAKETQIIIIKQIIKDPLKLTKLSLNIEEINKSIENQENSIFRNKYFMYLTGSGTLIVIIVS